MILLLTDENVGVVKFVILSDPSADEAPGGLNSGVCSESGSLHWLSAKLGLGPHVAGSQFCGEGRVGLLNEV